MKNYQEKAEIRDIWSKIQEMSRKTSYLGKLAHKNQNNIKEPGVGNK